MNINKSSSTLFTKVFILIFLGIFLVLSIFSYQATILQKESALDNMTSKAKNMGKSITLVNTDSMILDDEIKILEFTYDFVQVNKDIKKLTVAREKSNSLVIKQKHWELDEYTKEKESQNIKILNSISYSEDLKEEVFKYSYSVQLSTVHWGWLHFELSLDDYNKKLNSMYKQFLIIAIIMIITMIAISYLIAKMVSKPIVTLENISEEIYNGNLTKRVSIESNDEIGRLSLTFNKMIDSLEKSQDELKKSHYKLEERVQERTDELEKKSTQLSELNDNLENIVIDEISKRQKQEQLLIQQSKLASMGEMIGNIAHQWRQPLNALSLVIQNIQLSYMMGDLNDEFIEKSVKKANLLTSTMSGTIDDFRSFFKTNKVMLDFSLKDIVEKSLSLVNPTFVHQNIMIKQEYLNDVTVYGFKNEFSQVILNILTNTKDAFETCKDSDNSPSVFLLVTSNDDYGIVTIKDNAGGINPNIIDKVFDPYFTTKEEGKGTGIGLYMSKIIIEDNMNGKLTVNNIKNGVEFTVMIPLSKKLF